MNRAGHELHMGEGKCQRMLGQRDERCRKSQRDPGELREEGPQEKERQVTGTCPVRRDVCSEH